MISYNQSLNIMNKEEKLKLLRDLSEEELTKKFLIPLYESDRMGCKNVRYTHKKLEFGKDIIYYKEDENGNIKYTGVQVKTIKISTSDISNIFRQICEGFGERFTDLGDGKKKNLDRFVVLTSNDFIEEAKESLWASLKGAHLEKVVDCIDGNLLFKRLDQFLPIGIWDEYDYFKKYFIAMKSDVETMKAISAIGQRNKPIPLERIYVSLRLCEKIKEPEHPEEEKRKIFKEDSLTSGAAITAGRRKILDADRVIKYYRNLVLIGGPGSGKTTLLKYLAMRSCQEYLENQEIVHVPIMITLRELSESRKNLRQYINKVFEKHEFPKADKFIEKELKEGKSRLLLDGFDDLVSRKNQRKIVAQIQKFASKYRKCQIIVTSRGTGYHDELSGFAELELMEFDDKRIKKFVENWFGVDSEEAKSIVNVTKEHEQIGAIARNPLMLAIIATIRGENKPLPQKRAVLYDRCAEVLLDRWDVLKEVKNKYTSKQKMPILRKLAFYNHTNKKRAMTRKEILDETLKYFPYMQLKREEVKAFLDEIMERSYLLTETSIDSYKFLHLSFQEYFTALELKTMDEGLFTIIQYMNESWWEEPILLYAGLREDATALIRKIKEIPEDIFYSNLMLCGRCLADTDFVEPFLRQEIIDALWHLYKEGKFSLLRNNAVGVLALIKSEDIIGRLTNELQNGEKDVRCKAIEALGRIGGDKAIDILTETLIKKDEDGKVLGIAASMLGRIGGENAVKPLIQALASGNTSYVRWNSAKALGEIGNEKAVIHLIQAIAPDEPVYVRQYATRALGEIGSDKAVKPLIEIITDTKENYQVRENAARAFREISNEKEIEPLIQTLSTNIDWRAVRMLGEMGGEKEIELLIKALNEGSTKYIRCDAAEALGKIGGEKVVERLIRSLYYEKEVSVRAEIISALGEIGSEKAVDSLIEVLSDSKENDIKVKIAEALGKIGSGKAIRLLRNLSIFDEGEWLGEKVKDVAFTSLEKIGKRIGKRINIEKEWDYLS